VDLGDCFGIVLDFVARSYSIRIDLGFILRYCSITFLDLDFILGCCSITFLDLDFILTFLDLDFILTFLDLDFEGCYCSKRTSLNLISSINLKILVRLTYYLTFLDWNCLNSIFELVEGLEVACSFGLSWVIVVAILVNTLDAYYCLACLVHYSGILVKVLLVYSSCYYLDHLINR